MIVFQYNLSKKTILLNILYAPIKMEVLRIYTYIRLILIKSIKLGVCYISHFTEKTRHIKTHVTLPKFLS